jgi:Gram-negative bacterial TonB protein C-terminal
MRILVTILACMLSIPALAKDGDKVALAEIAERAVQQSKLTLPGSKPFHLQAEIVESTNPKSDYKAKVEEYWVSPQKWRRVIESPEFSQVLIVNGDQISERDTGDYLPWWLNDLITAMTDPLPMLDKLKQTDSEIAKPHGSEHSTSCADLRGTNDWSVFCFEGSHGLLASAVTRGYEADFQDFKSFGDKRVPRLLLIDPESGTTIEARITELTELRKIDETLFAVSQATPPREQIKSVKVDEALIRSLALNSTEIVWPPVKDGVINGRCAVYLSADRLGHVREVWPGGCDNAGLDDSLREMVGKWQLKPFTENGAAVQIEALVTFAFATKILNKRPIPNPPDAETPQAAVSHVPLKGPPVVPPRIIQMVKPDCSRGQSCYGIHGTVVVVVDVLADGTAGEVSVRSGDPKLFDDATRAAKQCHFQAGTLLGKPTSMNFDIQYKF